MDSSINTGYGYAFPENKPGNIVLTAYGSETTLKDLIAKQIVSNQKKNNLYQLNQDALVITHTDVGKTICGSIESQLVQSDIHWNRLSFNGSSGVQGDPEIFSSLGFPKIIKAATSAGLFKPAFYKTYLFSALLVLISIVVLGAIIYFGRNILQFRDYFFVIAGTLVFMMVAMDIILVRYLLRFDQKTREILSEKAHRCKSLENNGEKFVQATVEEILNLDMPMAIVVENVTKLDPFTAQVITGLLNYKNPSIGCLFWIFVIDGSVDTDTKWLDERVKSNTSINVVHYQLVINS